MNLKKSDNENITNKFRYFLESGFVGVNRLIALVYSNQDANAKSLMLENIVYQKK